MEGTTLHGLLWHWGRSGCCEVWTDVCVEIVYGVIFPTSGEIVRDHGQIKPCVNVDGASPLSEGGKPHTPSGWSTPDGRVGLPALGFLIIIINICLY